jgi:hypothetical protein
MGETDELRFEYLDRTAWHRSARPRKLDAFFRPAKLRLSPLPRLKGLKREVARQSVQSWLGQRARSHGGSQGAASRAVLGIPAIISAAFESRSREPKRSRRPYAFGSKEARQAYYHSVSIVYEAYAQRSEQFRSGRYHVTFPPGTYHPPSAKAA